MRDETRMRLDSGVGKSVLSALVRDIKYVL